MTSEPETDLNKEIIQWACKYLLSHGYTLKNNIPENVKNTPWSYVVCFTTSKGFIYLKHTPNLLALEARINQILHHQFHASVPEVIAHNKELDCFLMKDAGMPLRDILKKQFNVELLCHAIEQFTSMQLAVADHVDIFLDIGVPDWRLQNLPNLYTQLLSQKDLLISDGLSEKEIGDFERLVPEISNLCKKLSNYSIKETIVQPDFHDNNILIDNPSQKVTIIDLGEIVISHPFFSLATCLYQIKRHYAVREEENTYQQLLDSCLKNYINFESKKHLLEAFATVNTLWLVYGILAQQRLMLGCDKASLRSFQGRGKLHEQMKEFMKVCNEASLRN